MKGKSILFLLSVSFVAGASLYQADQPAEKVYKNIKVMTGTPASDVIPSMKFMCASLKVDCEFCHEENNFAADTKEGKESARHMIEMQKDINEKHFNGRTSITCNSCHNGSLHPNRTPSPVPNNRRSIKRGTGDASAVVKKYLALAGNVTSVTLTGTASGMGPKPAPAKIVQGEDGKFMSVVGPRSFGFDGTNPWFAQGGHGQALPMEHLADIKKVGGYYRGSHAFDSFPSLAFAGTDKVDGQDVVVLRSGGQGSPNSADLYFGAKSGLLVRITTYTTTSLGLIADVLDYGDYHKVGGAMVPFKITGYEGGNQQVILITKGTAGAASSASTFAMPK